MITWTLLIWMCAASGCHQEPIRPVYARLTAPACVDASNP